MTWYDDLLHQMANQLFSSDVSVIAYPIVFLGGLLTNFCPCNVALVPMVLGCVGGFSRSKERGNAILYSCVFAAGIVITLSVLGVLAAVVGTLVAPLQKVCVWLLAVVALFMGLYCLDVVDFKLPGLGKLPIRGRKGIWETFLVGLAGGVVATPCTTPVLAVILAYVAVKARVVFGVSLLFTYAVGFVVPLVLAGVFADFLLRLKQLQEKTRYRDWINKGGGVILILFGLYLVKRAVWP
jgi:cytochrome c-type biogenesis protein